MNLIRLLLLEIREISILRAIYGMESKNAECSDIVVKARGLLQEYDRMDAMADRKSKPAGDATK